MRAQREILSPKAVLRESPTNAIRLRAVFRPRILVPVLWLVLGLLTVPGLVSAQETVYQASDLTQQPRIADANQARTAIMRSYTSALQNAGLTGRVQVAFVVKADGSVDSESVEVLSAPANALGTAAKVAVARIKFQPGEKDGTPVHCRVVMPISYGAAG